MLLHVFFMLFYLCVLCLFFFLVRTLFFRPFFFFLLKMRYSLKDQLSLEELRKEFEKFADSKIARELPDFYKACLDREEIEDFFERQAATTAIIDRRVFVK